MITPKQSAGSWAAAILWMSKLHVWTSAAKAPSRGGGSELSTSPRAMPEEPPTATDGGLQLTSASGSALSLASWSTAGPRRSSTAFRITAQALFSCWRTLSFFALPNEDSRSAIALSRPSISLD